MDLPPLLSFADEVARAVGGKVVSLDNGEWPSAVVHVGEHCALLIRDHHGAFTLSLPIEGTWSVRSRADWAGEEPKVQRAVAAYVPIVSMSDVIARLPREWSVEFPGTPNPSEVWLRRGEQRVGLFQQERSVKAVVWEGSTMHDRELATLGAIQGLSAWLDDKLALQEAARVKAARDAEAEAKQKAALPAPELARVLAALRAGKKFVRGGGRWNETYEMRDGKLFVVLFDEGYTEEQECSEETLAAAMDREPDAFRAPR